MCADDILESHLSEVGRGKRRTLGCRVGCPETFTWNARPRREER